MKSSIDIYNSRDSKYEALILRQKHLINFISFLRFIIFAAGTAFAVYFYIYKKYYFSFSLMSITLFAFLILVVKHNRVIANKNLAVSIKAVNNASIKRASGQWKAFEDTGEDFITEEHNYSGDLDVFGYASLFQWINSASTTMGREKLSQLLDNPPLDRKQIIARQEAILELENYVGWRQRLEAEGNLISKQNKGISELISWCSAKTKLPYMTMVWPLLIVFPALTCGSLLYYFIKPQVGYALPLVFIAISIALLKLIEKTSREVLDTCYKYKNNLKAYHRMLQLIEEKNFSSHLLNELKLKVTDSNGLSASTAINSLSKIADKISDRSNFFSIVINVLFLMDYHLILSLDKWRQRYGLHVEDWMSTIGHFEGLSSLSNIGFNNKEWTVPVFNTGNLLLRAQDAAHPLLSQNAVSNSVILDENQRVVLVTGSNMSGKSTFLRTLGVNLVLAYAGAPVRAKFFQCSIMNIYTCMRISDNLEKNISSFYAEIMKIRKIVSAAKEGETIFYLLDEIFKGTNSVDRHLGAETLINSLSKQKALGLVSTHDLELSELENKNTKVKNYSFQEYYENNEIKFDYKLRNGVSKTRNAVYLMKLAGIDFE